MIHFLITFLLMLLSGSIFILGFYTITRGKIITLPNGDTEEEKEILGNWQLFWEEVLKYNKQFYYGDQLEFKLKILEQLKPAYMGEVDFSTKGRKSLIFNKKLLPHEIRDIEFSLNCKIFSNEEIIFLYDEVPVYRFSEWVRKITNCYVCLSSLGGTFMYWSYVYFFPNIFSDLFNPTAAKVFFWIAYCISLSFVNKVIKENFDNEQK